MGSLCNLPGTKSLIKLQAWQEHHPAFLMSSEDFNYILCV